MNNKLLLIRKNIVNIIFIVIFTIFNISVAIDYVKNKFAVRVNIQSLIFILIILPIILIIVRKKINKKSIEKKFLVFFVIMGSLFLFLLPLNSIPDEGAHISRAYEVSMGNIISHKYQTEKNTYIVGRKLPGDLKKYLDTIGYKELKDTLKLSSNSKKKIFDFPNTSYYSFIVYLPQATGIAISRVFTSSLTIQLYVGRIFNFIVAAILLYNAIKIIPNKKHLIFLLVFFPTSMQEFISLSSDSLTIAFITFFISYILYLKNKKNKYINLLSVFIIAAIFGIIWFLIANSLLSASSGGKSIEQLKFILLNPHKFLFICITTINQQFIYLTTGSLGKELTCVGINLPDIYVFFNFLIFSTYILDENNKKDKNLINNKNRIFILLIFTLICAIIFTSLYIQFTPYMQGVISGIQGRYLIPILILIPFGIYPIKTFIKCNREKLINYSFYIMILSNSCVICLIYNYFLLV